MDKYSTIGIKEKLFAHLETWRPYTVIWCGLVSLAGSCLVHNSFPSLKTAALSFFIPMMGWTAGLYLSDFLDRKLDAIQKPHRPIPSGRIKPIEALIIGGIIAFSGLFLSFLLSFNNMILVFVVALLVFLYAKISKSYGVSGNLNRGFITVAAYFFGVFSLNQPVHLIPLHIWLLSLVFLLHDTNSNLVGAIRDVEGDRQGGYNTVPVKYGIKISIFISLVLTFCWLFLSILLPFYFGFMNSNFYLIMIIDVFIVIILYIYLFKSMKDYTREKGLYFHEFFVIERIILSSAFIYGIVNIYIASSILLVALLVTIVSQYLLRKRYEFKEIT
jgi:4-hydroxybenzoate polyprenyltransferase/geranylgeranylglycerol-phosphate geranylgeranyltransferase